MNDNDINKILDKRQYVLSPEDFDAFVKQLNEVHAPNPKLVAVLKQNQSWEELFSKGKDMQKRKWYTFSDATNKNIDIKEPSLEKIRSHYVQDSCVHEPDSDLDCVSCVINFLIERVEKAEGKKE